jgi:hypothetical protein
LTRLRRLLIGAATVAAAGLAVLGWSYRTARLDPVVRHAEYALPGYDGRALTALLISDLHVAGPDMPPERLSRIVAQINALRPDLVLIAGDLVSDKRTGTRRYSMAEAVAPLAALRPRLATVAVLGNHDHWRSAGEAVAALEAAAITVLSNDAVRIGPIAVGGLDDDYTSRADLPRTLARQREIGGVPVLLSHSPDPFPELPAGPMLMLAGHTHCGQIRLPLIGALSTMSDSGDRYACGLVREKGRTLIVGAGVGTSILPLRLGAVPDMWLIRLVPDGGRTKETAAP